MNPRIPTPAHSTMRITRISSPSACFNATVPDRSPHTRPARVTFGAARARASLALCALVLVAVGCGDGATTANDAGAGATQTWRFALEEIEGSVQDAYARRFEERIEALTRGRVDVVVYPYGALGTSAQLTEQVQQGALQLAFASPGHLGSVVPEAQVFLLHFLLPEDSGELLETLGQDGALQAALAPAYRERGLALLGLIPEGWMLWTGDRPLRTPADFDGFKIRTMTSPLLLDVYRAYGASPTPLPYGEVYSALQLGMIDGQVNPAFAIEEMSFHEVQAFITDARHLQYVSSVVTSAGFHDGLDAELRGALEAALADAYPYVFDVQTRLNAERMETMRAGGGTELVRLTEEERDAFRRASLAVRDRYRADTGERGAEILAALRDDAALQSER
jgi:TRAP-type C4-dicarboxylate transport system substrate-binding protein